MKDVYTYDNFDTIESVFILHAHYITKSIMLSLCLYGASIPGLEGHAPTTISGSR